MAEIVIVDGFEIEVGSATYERLRKQGKLRVDVDQTPSTEPGAGGDNAGGEKDLAERKRGELDEIAAGLGVAEPEKLPNKAAVLEAIANARAAAAGAGGDNAGGETLTT